MHLLFCDGNTSTSLASIAMACIFCMYSECSAPHIPPDVVKVSQRSLTSWILFSLSIAKFMMRRLENLALVGSQDSHTAFEATVPAHVETNLLFVRSNANP